MWSFHLFLSTSVVWISGSCVSGFVLPITIKWRQKLQIVKWFLFGSYGFLFKVLFLKKIIISILFLKRIKWEKGSRCVLAARVGCGIASVLFKNKEVWLYFTFADC